MKSRASPRALRNYTADRSRGMSPGGVSIKMTPLFWRAVAAFVAMPLLVAFVIPLALRPPRTPFRAIGLPFLVVGAAVLLACVVTFHTAGRGTLAPWAPPRKLVRVGLYRFSRNPMYVGVLLILVGWAVGFSSTPLWFYACLLAIAFNLRVIYNEEPWLERTHGEEWRRYRATVFRWFGRRRSSR